MAYNIIFIDDSESMQKVVSTIFINNTDFNLNSISEPSSLFKIAKDFHPDIIILSYDSINTEIQEIISEIKTSESLSGVPLLLLVPSDLSDNERDLLVQDGFNGFMYRPFEKEVFLSKIKRILGIIDAAPGKENENKVRLSAGPAKPASKIYDISSLEIKEANKNKAGTATPASSATPSVAEDAEKANENDFMNSTGYISDDGINIDSAELSQSFENLFKDDAIFKEFQELNKKDEPDSAANKPEYGEWPGVSDKIPEENPETKEEPESSKSNEENIISEPIKDLYGIEPPSYDYKGGFTTDTKNKILTKGGLKLEILDEQSLIKLDESLKNSLQKIMEEIKPEIIKNIKDMLPEIIEGLIKGEIEKIKQAATNN